MSEQTNNPETLFKITPPTLAEGSNEAGSGKFCFAEFMAVLAGEPHSDNPKCSCPVLSAFIRPTNDWVVPAGYGYLLEPLLLPCMGTRSPKHEQQRAELLAMRAINVIVPIALDGLIDAALVPALRDAKTLKEAAAASAAKSVWYTKNAANSNNAAKAAIYAARAAVYAADAAPDKREAIVAATLEAFKDAIELGPHGGYAPTPEDIKRCVEAGYMEIETAGEDA